MQNKTNNKYKHILYGKYVVGGPTLHTYVHIVFDVVSLPETKQ